MSAQSAGVAFLALASISYASAALSLVLELARPFTGLNEISSEPLVHALAGAAR